MTRDRRLCLACGRRVAVTGTGLLWLHGRPHCPGSRRRPHRVHYWPKRHHGRRVRTIPGPDTWNPTQGAA